MKKIVLLISLCFGACKTVELKVTPVNASTKIDGSVAGIVYSLPKKEYYLEVKVEKLTLTPGKLYDACADEKIQKLLIGNPIKASNESFEIISASLQFNVVPDDSKQYFAAITNANRSFVDGKLNFEFTESGLIKSSSLESENKGLEFGIKAGSAIINAAIGVAALPVGAPKAFIKKGGEKDSIVKWSKKDCKSDGALKRLEEIQNIKIDLLTCQICEKQNIKEILGLLNAEEKRLVALLAGTKQSDTLIYRIPLDNLINPSRIGQTDMALFTLLPNGTIVAASSYTNGTPSTGETVYGKLSSYNFNSSSQLYALADFKTGTAVSGLRYNLPAVCKLEIHDSLMDHKIKIESIEVIPQLGKVAALASKIGKHKSSQSFTLDTKTGALLQYNMTSSAPDKTTFDPIIDQINKIPDNVSKLSKTQREIENLKIQTEYLKALKEYKEQLKAEPAE